MSLQINDCDKIFGMETRIVFMGSPDFSIPILEELHSKYPIVGVVTQPDRPAGRGRNLKPPAVKVLAESLGIPTIQPDSLKEENAMAQLHAWAPDLIVVAAFGQILRKNVLELPKYGCINVHASLLPRWRGASPIQAAILEGDARTGVTIMRMEAGLDSGPILAQREVPLRNNTTGGELSDQLSFLGAHVLVEVLPSYLSGMVAPMPQDEALATYANKLKKSNGLINIHQPALRLARQILAYNPWPGAFYRIGEKILKIHRAHVHNSYDCEIGAHYIVNNLPALGTAESLLVLDVVQPEGKKSMTGDAFLMGLSNWL
jgi:methionyl-tRNA formyltransferase